MSDEPIRFSGGPNELGSPPKEEYLKTYGAFMKYLATVWVNENDVPTEPPDLIAFDVDRLLPQYAAFIDAGGELPKHGLTLEECVLLNQLMLRSPVTCLINAAQPVQPVDRISRFRKISAAEIWSELKAFFSYPELEQILATPVREEILGNIKLGVVILVYDGDKIAHSIAAFAIRNDEIHFLDPWPDRSLLCEENNSAGVTARTSDIVNVAWRINADEFQRVVFSALLYPHSAMAALDHVRNEDKKRRASEEADYNYSFMMALNYLITNDPKMQALGVKPFSRLEAAIVSGHEGRIKAAIDDGDDVNNVGANGPPLHLAAQWGKLESAKLLVEHGADHRTLNTAGKTAREVAEEMGYSDVAEYLKSIE